MNVDLAPEEREKMLDALAAWAVRLGIQDIVAFLLEVNRPVGTLTGNSLIAADPVFRSLVPFSLHDAGLLLFEEGLARDFRAKVRAMTAAGAAGGQG